MKIKKCCKLVRNLYDKNNDVVIIWILKQELVYESMLEKVHKVIQLNEKACLKLYIDINTKLRTEGKNDFGKDCF